MRFLRPSVSLVTILTFCVRATAIAYADEPPLVPPADARWHEPDVPASAAPPELIHVQPADLKGRPTVLVHIDADHAVDLEANRGPDQWSPVCPAPCDINLPQDVDYRLTARDTRPSIPFNLAGSPGQHVRIVATTPSKASSANGIALVVVGSVTTVVGLVVDVGAALSALAQCAGQAGLANPPPCGVSTGVEVGGTIAIGAGVVMLLVGIALIQDNRRVDQTQTVSAIVPNLTQRSDAAWLRAPMWRDSVKRGATGGNLGIPIFSGRF